MRIVIEQPRLFPPPKHSLDAARTAIRRAQERALTAKPPAPRRPAWDPPSVSHPPATVDPVPRGRIAADPSPHGTRARYSHKTHPCRCPACKAANARYQASYRIRTTEVRGRAARLAQAREVVVAGDRL